MKYYPLMRRTIVIVSVLLISTIVVMLIGLAILSKAAESVGEWVSSDSSCLGTKPYAVNTIEQMARIAFPASMTGLQVEASGIQDCEIFLSFNMKPDELPDFVLSTYLEAPLSAGRLPLYFDDFPAALAWSLDSEKSYLVGEGVKNGEHQYIAVDTDDPLHYTVYFATFLP